MGCIRNSCDDCKKGFADRAKIGFERFFTENGRYPTSIEIDKSGYIPTSKMIQRRVGGVAILREMMGLEITDYTKGKTRSDKARICIQESERTQLDVYELLNKKFGRMFVHRESPYGDASRQRSDFEVHHKYGYFYIDAFHPGSQRSFHSCLNFKIKKYINPSVSREVIFLNTNPEINCDISKKKIPLAERQRVMSYKEFVQYINKITPLEVR